MGMSGITIDPFCRKWACSTRFVPDLKVLESSACESYPRPTAHSTKARYRQVLQGTPAADSPCDHLVPRSASPRVALRILSGIEGMVAFADAGENATSNPCGVRACTDNRIALHARLMTTALGIRSILPRSEAL